MTRARLKRRARIARQHWRKAQRLDRLITFLSASAVREMQARTTTISAARGRETANTILHGYAAGVLRDALRSAL